MSVKSNLIEWLNKFPNFAIGEFIQDEITDGEESYGISREPQRIEKKFIDGTKMITEYYTFLAKRLVTNNTMRKENDDFLESLENWIREQDLPNLGTNIVCDGIEITGGGFLQSVKDRYGMYSLTIELQYRKD